MIQFNMFEKLPPDIINLEWMKEHIKNPPPVNVTEEQRRQAQDKIEKIKQLTNNKTHSL